ncbi:MAG: hydantoinase/oxoprolinase family protein, partial [Gammaproteobacteria bacterium]
FLGGRMRLDVDAARAAIDRIAEPLGISTEAAAYSIFTVSNETMINAIKDITVSEGLDPAESVIVAGGGAAGLGIMPIARELSCRAVVIPRTASVLSACGMQFSDIQLEHTATLPTRSDHFDRAAVNAALDAIDAVLDHFAARLAERGFDDRRTEYRVDAHYAAQVWDIAVPLPARRLTSAAEVEALVEDFHAHHRRIFSVDDRASPIEFLNWIGRLAIRLPQAEVRASARARADAAAGTRRAYFGLDEALDAAIVRGAAVAVGDVVQGPAIVEEATTTIVLPPGARAALSPADSYVVEWSD